MSLSPNYGLVSVIFPGPGELLCRDRLCSTAGKPTAIRVGEAYFLDTMIENRAYCPQCGQCLRYARKKAEQRGDDPAEASLDF